MAVSPECTLRLGLSHSIINNGTFKILNETAQLKNSYNTKPALAALSLASSSPSSHRTSLLVESDESYFQNGSNDCFCATFNDSRCCIDSRIPPLINECASVSSFSISWSSCSNVSPLSDPWPTNHDRCNTPAPSEEDTKPCSWRTLFSQVLPSRQSSFSSTDARNANYKDLNRRSKPLPCPSPRAGSPVPDTGAEYHYDLATWAMFHRISGARRNHPSNLNKQTESLPVVELKNNFYTPIKLQQIEPGVDRVSVDPFPDSGNPIETSGDDNEDIFEMDD